MSRKQLVFICSPFNGDTERNTVKAAGYCRFAYTKGFTPYAPHIHNPIFLDESIPEEREAGISLGLEVLKRCDELWSFGKAASAGMQVELSNAKENGIPIKYFNERCEEVSAI
jgi:hypothetical protein